MTIALSRLNTQLTLLVRQVLLGSPCLQSLGELPPVLDGRAQHGAQIVDELPFNKATWATGIGNVLISVQLSFLLLLCKTQRHHFVSWSSWGCGLYGEAVIQKKAKPRKVQKHNNTFLAKIS